MATVLRCGENSIYGMMIQGFTGNDMASDIFVRGLINVTMRKVCLSNNVVLYLSAILLIPFNYFLKTLQNFVKRPF